MSSQSRQSERREQASQSQQPTRSTGHLINRIRGHRNLVLVAMNEVKIAFSPPHGDTLFLATEGLNACTAAAIYSPTAGIMAHIPPRNPEFPERGGNTQNKLAQIRWLYESNLQHFQSRDVFVLAAVYLEELALQDMVRVRAAFLMRDLRIAQADIMFRNYPVLRPTEITERGQTSVVLWWKERGRAPVIVVNSTAVSQTGAQSRAQEEENEETSDEADDSDDSNTS